MAKSSIKKYRIFILFALVFIVMLRLVAAVDNYHVEVTDVSPTNLIPGEKNQLTFKIKNTGDIDLNTVIFSWEEKTGNILPVGSSNTKSIDSLNTDDEETFNFDVFTSASATPGLYELTLTIKFNDDNGTPITETSEAGIIVGGQTDFDVSVSDISSSGIILSVSNIGKNPADSVTIILPEQTNIRISGSSSSIIGNLNKGDYSVASFQAIPLSRGSSDLNVEIQYTDTTGVRQTITKTIQVQYTQQSSQSTGSSSSLSSSSSSSRSISGFASQNTTTKSNNWIIIGFISSGILAVILVVIVIKRNKKKNEN